MCAGPDSTVCDAVAGAPAPEICDNDIDEDCDGVADDGCPPPGCTSDAECGAAGAPAPPAGPWWLLTAALIRVVRRRRSR